MNIYPSHTLDPRVAIGIATAWSVSLVAISALPVLGLATAMAAGAMLVVRLPIRRWRHALAPIVLFSLMLWATVPWSTDGQTIITWGPIQITNEGIRLAAELSLRCIAVVLGCVAVLGKLSTAQVADGLARLGVPAKLAAIVHLCVRYVALIGDEADRMQTAARLRGFRPSTNIHTYRTTAQLAGQLLVRSHDRAERVYEAMRCRGYDGRFPMLRRDWPTWRDGFAMGVLLVSLALLGVLEWQMH